MWFNSYCRHTQVTSFCIKKNTRHYPSHCNHVTPYLQGLRQDDSRFVLDERICTHFLFWCFWNTFDKQSSIVLIDCTPYQSFLPDYFSEDFDCKYTLKVKSAGPSATVSDLHARLVDSFIIANASSFILSSNKAWFEVTTHPRSLLHCAVLEAYDS